VLDFFKRIENGTVLPEMKNFNIQQQQQHQKNHPQTSNDNDTIITFPTNQHGVHLLTGQTLPKFLYQYRNDHVLLLLYAPTCGHCKRFNIVWNALGDLLQYIGWNDQSSTTSTSSSSSSVSIKLARIDVSSNEFFIPGLTTHWLPDMFYFGCDSIMEYPIDYEKTEMAKTVQLGSIHDPLDLIEWWIDQAGESIDTLVLLQSLIHNDDDDTNNNNTTTTMDTTAATTTAVFDTETDDDDDTETYFDDAVRQEEEVEEEEDEEKTYGSSLS
jgi:hypothetical protein